jgi:Arc/MetJ-type ribon-helix-helix transcriptional regulator
MSENKDVIVSVKVPVWMVKEIDSLVKLNRYLSRSDFIRTAIRELLRKEISSMSMEINIKRKRENTRIVDAY